MDIDYKLARPNSYKLISEHVDENSKNGLILINLINWLPDYKVGEFMNDIGLNEEAEEVQKEKKDVIANYFYDGHAKFWRIHLYDESDQCVAKFECLYKKDIPTKIGFIKSLNSYNIIRVQETRFIQTAGKELLEVN